MKSVHELAYEICYHNEFEVLKTSYFKMLVTLLNMLFLIVSMQKGICDIIIHFDTFRLDYVFYGYRHCMPLVILVARS